MGAWRVDKRSKRPWPSSQPATTLRSAPCAAQNRRTARNLEPPPTDNRFGIPRSHPVIGFGDQKYVRPGHFSSSVERRGAETCCNSLSALGTLCTSVRTSTTGWNSAGRTCAGSRLVAPNHAEHFFVARGPGESRRASAVYTRLQW